jgi:hypothetical protein
VPGRRRSVGAPAAAGRRRPGPGAPGPVPRGRALSRAAAEIQSKLAASPALQSALGAFSEKAPPPVVGAVHSGPLGANAIPGNPLKEVAFTALDNAYSLGFVVCGVAALVAAVLALAALTGASHEPLVTEESLQD